LHESDNLGEITKMLSTSKRLVNFG